MPSRGCHASALVRQVVGVVLLHEDAVGLQISIILGSWISDGISLATRTRAVEEPTLRRSITRVPDWITTNDGSGRRFAFAKVLDRVERSRALPASWCCRSAPRCRPRRRLPGAGAAPGPSRIRRARRCAQAPRRRPACRGCRHWVDVQHLEARFQVGAIRSPSRFAAQRPRPASSSTRLCHGPPWSRASRDLALLVAVQHIAGEGIGGPAIDVAAAELFGAIPPAGDQEDRHLRRCQLDRGVHAVTLIGPTPSSVQRFGAAGRCRVVDGRVVHSPRPLGSGRQLLRIKAFQQDVLVMQRGLGQYAVATHCACDMVACWRASGSVIMGAIGSSRPHHAVVSMPSPKAR